MPTALEKTIARIERQAQNWLRDGWLSERDILDEKEFLLAEHAVADSLEESLGEQAEYFWEDMMHFAAYADFEGREGQALRVQIAGLPVFGAAEDVACLLKPGPHQDALAAAVIESGMMPGATSVLVSDYVIDPEDGAPVSIHRIAGATRCAKEAVLAETARKRIGRLRDMADMLDGMKLGKETISRFSYSRRIGRVIVLAAVSEPSELSPHEILERDDREAAEARWREIAGRKLCGLDIAFGDIEEPRDRDTSLGSTRLRVEMEFCRGLEGIPSDEVADMAHVHVDEKTLTLMLQFGESIVGPVLTISNEDADRLAMQVADSCRYYPDLGSLPRATASAN